MYNNIDFALASLFVFGILIGFHFHRKNLPIVQNKAFLTFLILSLLSAILDICSALVLKGYFPVPKSVVWLINGGILYLNSAIPVCYVIYCSAIVNFFDKKNARQISIFKLCVAIPFVFLLVLISVSPFMYKFAGIPILFSVNHYQMFQTGPLYHVFFGGQIYFLVISAIIIMLNRKEIPLNRTVLMIAFVAVMIVAVTVQTYMPTVYVQDFTISLSAIMCSSLLQTPEEFIDKKTGCFNQAAFVKMTNYYLRPGEEFLSVTIILDDTLFITNAFGVNQMTRFLKMVSTFLSETFPEAEIYYLPQGKFTLVFQDYNPRNIDRYIFEIRARFHEPWISDALELKLYSHICVTECPRDAKTPEAILDIIDLVTSESHQRSSIVYARDIDTEYKKHTAYIAHLLRNALAEERFDVYYQPICSTAEKKLIGAEALIRMKDENGEFVSPEEFIPISEKTGDILRIGQFVFDSVCKTLSGLDLELYGIRKIDINLSVAQCMQEILAEQILTIRTIHRVPSSIINLEITETAAAHTPEILLNNMKRLAAEGIELSLDDYGSGYSNMNYLLNLPFKMVKIDKNIVWTAFEDEKAEIALSATIDMIKKLGMTVLAEGVETKAQATWLTKMGCDYLQGFYFAKGLPKEEFLTMMIEKETYDF